ncbi:glycogen synthase GlgA [Tropicimonas sp. IMCC34011]|uniref:glycogen synthase GlgA n=1 Tax=Tropicimonas sp. IMCC34011 TaxID=2248759 RepID=UPI000E21C988|nr:glycogen synthase GlgA [Tropicimonas sp. IMCC34011]
MMNVLSVTSECAPLVKTGGLADVAGALPHALLSEDVRMRTILPGYRTVMEALGDAREVLTDADVFGGTARILEGTAAGLDVFVVDAPHLYDRDGSPYLDAEGRDWEDNPERFAALCRLAARIAAEGAGDWRPDVVHLHDWQAGLTPLYLRGHGPDTPPCVTTIHNVAFHGIASPDKLDRLGLPRELFTPEGYEFYGQISALKAALVYSDKLTTVSPSYARELLSPEFGMGLDGVLRNRASDLYGILNGIDTAAWDPARDPAIPTFKAPRGKAKARARLIEEMGLDPEAPGPLAVVVSRLSGQKGLDLLLEALPALLARGGQLALLGSGDAALEHAFREAAAADPRVAVHIGYDEAMSHRMIAGGDAILVPSRFEPCGLTQLYGLRYGTVPVVALTGGLADTVIPANAAALQAGAATGLQFHPITAPALEGALNQLCDLYSDADTWGRIQRNAMKHPVGWGPSAAAYAALYKGMARTS